MSHIKSFNNFINESAGFNPKPFNKVKPGDIATVVDDFGEWVVIATAYGSEYDSKLKKYDRDRVIYYMKSSAASYGLEPGDFDESEFIVVKSGLMTFIYSYGDDGAWVNKK